MRIKKFFRAIWNKFVYGCHLLSIGASGILWSSAIIFDKPVSMPLLVVGYAMNKYFG